MDIKDIKIESPEGMMWYLEGDTIKFRPKQELTYDDIAKKLFCNKRVYYIKSGIDNCVIDHYKCTGAYRYYNNCISEKQAQKLLAINKLMNVAKYLNEDWIPDWNDKIEPKYYNYISLNNELKTTSTYTLNESLVYFKTKDLARQAIEILGEETIRLALSTDW